MIESLLKTQVISPLETRFKMNQQLVHTVKLKFTKEFNSTPLMIFSPGRINIIGEHTDYNDGFVFPAAVDKGIVAGLFKSNSDQSTAYAIDKNEKIFFQAKDVKPSKPGTWHNYILGVVAEINKKNLPLGNFNIAFAGNIPRGAGMSSSAALENSVVFGLNELFGLNLSKEEMIFISQKAEHHFVGVNCGIMDQYASMFGIENNALHLDCRSIQANPFKIELGEYQLLLINTNVKHTLSDSAYNNRRAVCEHISKLLTIKALRDATKEMINSIQDQVSKEDYQKALFIIQENQRTIDASKAIIEGDLNRLGALFYQSHEGLQHLYKVSCEELDFLVDATRDNKNILGSRMMGGGFGGCTINLIKISEVPSFSKYISKVYFKQFNINCSIYDVNLSDGTHIIK